MEHRDTLGGRIRDLRMESRASLSQLAGDLGVTKAAVAHWESDANAPTPPLIIKLAARFGVTTDYLLRGDGEIT